MLCASGKCVREIALRLLGLPLRVICQKRLESVQTLARVR